MQKKFHGAASDSILLICVKAVTAILGLLVTKLLSTHFSLQEYGTYSQAMLIVSTASSISVLGLTDAVNYFYNTAAAEEDKAKYTGTIFTIQYFAGLLCAVILLAAQMPVIQYFNNSDLKDILYLAAWQPLLQNLIPMLQMLFVSIGRAKLIAVRNFSISAVRFCAVLAACYITKSIRTIFIVLLILDIVQVVYFMSAFSRSHFKISVRQFSRPLLKPVLRFSIPMAVCVLANQLARDIDKFIVGFFSDTATLAVYTNAAKLLPFDIITKSFLTVLAPMVTRQIAAEDYEAVQSTFKTYLRLGYITTWLVVSGVVINAREAMLFLYAPKYLMGLPVFIVYLFVEMVSFASIGLILTAKGKANVLLICSIGALAANFFLSILLFNLLGVLGPAAATLVTTLGLAVVLLAIGGREIRSSIFRLFCWKEMGVVAAEMVLTGGCACLLKSQLYRIVDSFVFVFIVTYGGYLAIMLLLNRRRILDCLKTINRMK